MNVSRLWKLFEPVRPVVSSQDLHDAFIYRETYDIFLACFKDCVLSAEGAGFVVMTTELRPWHGVGIITDPHGDFHKESLLT